MGPSDFTGGGCIGTPSQQNNLMAGKYYLQQMAANQAEEYSIDSRNKLITGGLAEADALGIFARQQLGFPICGLRLASTLTAKWHHSMKDSKERQAEFG